MEEKVFYRSIYVTVESYKVVYEDLYKMYKHKQINKKVRA